jgi:methionyl-tRNA formyltransferase
VLAIPSRGTLNVHASLLPRWRGAAPVNHALLAGDTTTGVTIMLVDEGLDTGPILAAAATPIRPEETAEELAGRLAELGADLVATTLTRWLAGEIVPQLQDEAAATTAPRLHRADGWLDWTRPAAELARRVRALQPWPGTFSAVHGERLKVQRATPLSEGTAGADEAPPGTLLATSAGVIVVTGEGRLRLDVVQPEGKPAMSGAELLRGRPGWIGARLATPVTEAA